MEFATERKTEHFPEVALCGERNYGWGTYEYISRDRIFPHEMHINANVITPATPHLPGPRQQI